MNHRAWRLITLCIEESFQDLLIGQLTILGFNGFEQEKEYLGCCIPKQQWTSAARKRFQETLRRFKHEFPAADLSYSMKTIHEENWNKKWESQTGIVEATPNIIIKPSWKELPKKHRKKIVLHIDPKMSFGTGHHETTRLSLEMIEQFLRPKMNVLDFGCGTGILGIACMKLGARSVIALDNDPWAIENTKENIKRNHIQRTMTHRLGSINAIPRKKFDLVVANIDFRTFQKFIKTLSERTRKKGILILSGILTSDVSALLPLFRKHSLSLIELDTENEWTAIALRRMK
jgi:ribosomal protein L11 methyltransferase